MDILKPWVQGLNIQPSSVESWMRQAPKNQSFTYWCLTAGHVKNADYLNWAREHFGLATLNSDFFNGDVNRELWQKIKTVANWSEEMIPIHEWDGTIFIACVEPLENVNWSFNVQYVLASADNLKQYWQALNVAPTTIQMNSEKTFMGIPPTPDMQMPKIPDVPEGITLDAPVGLSIPDAPEGLSFDAPAGINLSAISPAKVDLNLPDNLNWSADSIDTSSSIHAPQETESPPFQLKQIKIESKIDKAPTKVSPAKSTNIVHANFLTKIKIDFNGGMILEVKNDNVIPTAWDENFVKSNDSADGVWSLSQPSAFRIAVRTKQPYLGHIVNTQVNKSFFEAWGFAELPKSVIIYPVIVDKMVTHLIFALSNGVMRNHHIMSSGEHLAAEFAKIVSSAKAA